MRITEWTFKKIEEKKGQSNKIEKKMGGGYINGRKDDKRARKRGNKMEETKERKGNHDSVYTEEATCPGSIHIILV